MGFYRGPKIVTNGLVLSLDAGNPKSYPGSGTVWTDKSGFGNNGTLINGPTFSNGSIVFDGVDDYVEINNSISNPTQLTVICFIKPNITATGIVWGYRSGGTELIQLTIQDTTTVLFQIRGSGNVLLNISLPIIMNNNYMIAGIFNRTTGIHTLYVNNISTTGVLNLSGQTLNSTKQYLGITSTPTLVAPFKGNISNVQIYNRALTSTEIQQNYNATKSRYRL